MKHWNALHLWQDIDYLNKIAGSRTVPIEIGSRYTEEDWSQDLIIFSEFLQSHIIKNTQKVGYLAQHQLFDQVLFGTRNIANYVNYCMIRNYILTM